VTQDHANRLIGGSGDLVIAPLVTDGAPSTKIALGQRPSKNSQQAPYDRPPQPRLQSPISPSFSATPSFLCLIHMGALTSGTPENIVIPMNNARSSTADQRRRATSSYWEKRTSRVAIPVAARLSIIDDIAPTCKLRGKSPAWKELASAVSANIQSARSSAP